MHSVVAMVLLVACGDNRPQTPDAAPSPRPDARVPVRGTVTIALGIARPNVQVFFQASDFRMLTRDETDAAGNASGEMEPGGYVTILTPYQHDTLAHIRTFAGVSPGDRLVMRDPDLVHNIGEGAFAMVTLPASTDPTVTYHELTYSPPVRRSTTFGFGPLTAYAEVYTGVTAMDFLLLAYDANNQLRTSLFAPNTPISGGFDLSARTHLLAVQHAVRYDDVPTAAAKVTEVLSTERDVVYTATDSGTTSMGTLEVETLQPVGTGAFNDYLFEALTPTSTIRLIDRRPYGAQFRASVGDRLVSDVTSCPVYAHGPSLVWTEAFHVAPNVAIATIGGNGWEWTMIGPVDGPMITFPKIDEFPTNGSKFRALSRAYLPVGYEAVRTAEFWPYRSLIERPGVVGEAWIADMDATSCAGL